MPSKKTQNKKDKSTDSIIRVVFRRDILIANQYLGIPRLLYDLD